VPLDLGVFVSSYLFVVGVTAVVAMVIVLFYGPQRFIKVFPKAGTG
jgi:hypothetical protein